MHNANAYASIAVCCNLMLGKGWNLDNLHDKRIIQEMQERSRWPLLSQNKMKVGFGCDSTNSMIYTTKSNVARVNYLFEGHD